MTKVLHMGFHSGCAKDIEFICNDLGYEFDDMRFDDGQTSQMDARIYNVTHEMADNCWNKYKDYFNSFDVIVTSDTAPISRVFLQNNFSKKLIIWVCNRFDYRDVPTAGNTFPDNEYYDLIRSIPNRTNVDIYSYTEYEHIYAKRKGIDVWDETIRPIGSKGLGIKSVDESRGNVIPSDLNKEETFFVPPYSNDEWLPNLLNNYGIPHYRGRYAGPMDLKEFKGVIHIPYAPSNLALFEGWNLGLVYFIPSFNFFRELTNIVFIHWSWPGLRQPRFNSPTAENLEMLTFSEWYREENQNAFVYFDSWGDLQYKVQTIDLSSKREEVKRIAENNVNKGMDQWRKIFSTKEKR